MASEYNKAAAVRHQNILLNYSNCAVYIIINDFQFSLFNSPFLAIWKPRLKFVTIRIPVKSQNVHGS